MFDPPGLNYSGLVPLSARNEIETIISNTFGALSDANVESTLCDHVLVIARTLYRVAITEPAWSADDYRSIVDDLITQLIDKCHVRLTGPWVSIFGPGAHHDPSFETVLIRVNPDGPPLEALRPRVNPPNSDGPLDIFRTRLRSALHASPAWTHYQHLSHELEPRPRRPATTAHSTAKRELSPEQVARGVAREQVVVPLLERLDSNPTTWALDSGVDPSVTFDYLSGRSIPRKVQRERIRETLAKALKRPNFQLPD